MAELVCLSLFSNLFRPLWIQILIYISIMDFYNVQAWLTLMHFKNDFTYGSEYTFYINMSSFPK